VKRVVSFIALAFASFFPAAAGAASVAATSIPDGTDTVKVVKVIDAKHLDVILSNGGPETTVAAGRSYVDFSKVQPNDQLKLSLISGNVMVYLDLTNH